MYSSPSCSKYGHFWLEKKTIVVKMLRLDNKTFQINRKLGHGGYLNLF